MLRLEYVRALGFLDEVGARVGGYWCGWGEWGWGWRLVGGPGHQLCPTGPFQNVSHPQVNFCGALTSGNDEHNLNKRAYAGGRRWVSGQLPLDYTEERSPRTQPPPGYSDLYKRHQEWWQGRLAAARGVAPGYESAPHDQDRALPPQLCRPGSGTPPEFLA